MGLFDKIKDLFTDEEEVYEDEKDNVVKIKEIKKDDHIKKDEVGELEENKLPTFMRERIEEEEKNKVEESFEEIKPDFNVSSRVNARINNNVYVEDNVEIPRRDDNSFKFPVEFDDNDFVPSRTKKNASIHNFEEISKNESSELKREEPIKKEKKVADLYKDKKDKNEGHKFKATPIISPIYGVLDKNYSKDQIKEADESSYEIKRSSISKNVDFESVRKKAYGSLTDDIKENLMCENCELLKCAKEEKQKKESVDNLVYDMLKDDEENNQDLNQDITFGDATENYYDYGVPYEIPKRNRIQEKNDEKEEVKIVNAVELEDKPVKKIVPPVKSSINLLSTLKKSMGEEVKSEETLENKNIETENKKKDLELTDDLFSLIDSMYDERND